MKKYLIPTLIYLCFAAIYVGISLYKHNDYLFQPVWDIEHYLSISEAGYKVYPCTPGYDGRAGEICGNSGWFPMWPLVVRFLQPLSGGSPQVAFVGLAFLFSLISFILFSRLMSKLYGSNASIFTLLAFALGPASFYLITGFPYALFALLFIIYLLLLYRPPGLPRDIFLFIMALAISLTYPTGSLVAVVPLVWYIFAGKAPSQSARSSGYWMNLFKYLAPFILGPLILWTYFYFKFDDFFLQLHFQAKYHRTWAFPLWVMLKSLFTQPILSPENLSILWYGLVFLVFLPYKVKTELWMAALVMYFFSLTTGTTMSIFRHHLIILPVYMLIGSSTRPLWLKIFYIVAGLVISLSILFPRFMAYKLM